MENKKAKAVATIVDKNHLPFLDNFFKSVVERGLWQEDFIILTHEVDEVDFLPYRNRFHIFPCKSLTTKNYRHWTPETLDYFYLFSDFFKQWENIIYLDIDCVVRAPIKRMGQVKGFWVTEFFSKFHKPFTISGVKLKGRDLFNDGVMAFSTDIIKSDTFSELLRIYRSLDLVKLPQVYEGGIDELVLAIYFLNNKRRLPFYFNVVPNQLRERYGKSFRDVRGVVIHHASGQYYPKPWKISSPFYVEWSGSFKQTSFLKEKLILFKILLVGEIYANINIFLGYWGQVLRVRSPKWYYFLVKLKNKMFLRN